MTALAVYEDAALTPEGMCAAAVAVLRVAGASIVLADSDDQPAATYTSGPAFERVEEIQYGLGAGPAIDAHARGAPVAAMDLRHDPPAGWGELSGALRRSGVAAVCAYPLVLGAARLGALTLYCSQPGPLGPERNADALVVAAVVTRALLAVQAGADDGMVASELADGEPDHAVVHQATGMVSAQLDVGVGEAMARLRTRARSDGSNVRTVAAAVVDRRIRFDR